MSQRAAEAGRAEPMLLARVARFGVVGGAATATHYLVLVALVEGTKLPPAPANGLAFLVACWLTFLGQSIWVFSDAAPMALGRRLTRFFASALSGLTANVGLMAALVDLAGLPYRAGFVACLLIVPPLGFALGRLWVFAAHAD